MQVPPPLPPADEIDWDAMMRDIAPPEWDLLLSAAAKDNLEQVRDLVERQGVPVSHSNGIGQTALHVAALWGHVNVARYLVQAGADVNAANQIMGATPLHAALSSHRISAEQQAALAHLLVSEGGADPQVEDKFGKCALDYIEKDQQKTHPLFQQQEYAAKLLPKLRPAPFNEDRYRAGFMREITRGMPACRAIPKKSDA